MACPSSLRVTKPTPLPPPAMRLTMTTLPPLPLLPLLILQQQQGALPWISQAPWPRALVPCPPRVMLREVRQARLLRQAMPLLLLLLLPLPLLRVVGRQALQRWT